MTRAAALLLAAAQLLHGQRARQPVAAGARTWVLDALALDAAGGPVNDLGPADFEVTLGGTTRTITAFTRFDTVLHSAHTAAGLGSALPITPEENRRIVIAVVDDVGLSPEGVGAVRDDLRALAGTVTASGGRMAVLRAGGGTGVLRQLTGDSRILNAAIDATRYLGGTASTASAGRATWQALTFALDGLAGVAGRKVVAVITESPCAPAPQGAASSDARHAAHVAAAAVYALRPGGAAIGQPTAACALASLARETGGQFGGELRGVLEQERSYYTIGIAQDEDAIDPMNRWSAARPADVKVLRAGVALRPRLGYVQPVLATDSLLPEVYAAVYNRALRSPFAGSSLSTRLSAILIDQRDTSIVQANLYIDPRDLTFTRDLEGVYHGSALIAAIVYKEYVRTPDATAREMQLSLKPDEMRQAMDKGIATTVEMRFPGPGAWQVHGIVADQGSDRIGSASQFIEIPDLKQTRFAIGGLFVIGDGASDPTARSFRQGETLTFACTTINETAVERKVSLEVEAKVLSGARTVLEGSLSRVNFEADPRGAHRRITGKLTLNDRVPPGDYLLQVTVRDVLAPAGKPGTAVQVIDFQVRQ